MTGSFQTRVWTCTVDLCFHEWIKHDLVELQKHHLIHTVYSLIKTFTQNSFKEYFRELWGFLMLQAFSHNLLVCFHMCMCTWLSMSLCQRIKTWIQKITVFLIDSIRFWEQFLQIIWLVCLQVLNCLFCGIWNTRTWKQPNQTCKLYSIGNHWKCKITASMENEGSYLKIKEMYTTKIIFKVLFVWGTVLSALEQIMVGSKYS